MKYFVKVGERYFRLVVLATHQRVNGDRQFYNLCRCDCGNTAYRTSSQLGSGATKSCGCSYRERLKRGNLIHGGSVRPNGERTVVYLYGFWLRTRSRCHHAEDPDYPEFGRKGIALAEEWREDYPAFRDWVEENLGPRPSPGYRLERWEREKGFLPGNLLWVTERQGYALRKGLGLIQPLPM
jgi:hypothetical protein